MIAIDTNILVHAHRADSSFHRPAYRCLEALASARERWAIPWPCVHEFLALVTSPRVFASATPLARAVEQVDAWLESPSLVLLGETPAHWSSLTEILRSARASVGLVHDARIAALCVQHGVRELWTADRGFSRFTGLATFDPLHGDEVHDARPAYQAARRARAAGRRRALARAGEPART